MLYSSPTFLRLQEEEEEEEEDHSSETSIWFLHSSFFSSLAKIVTIVFQKKGIFCYKISVF
jgi:hypothetical protein